jgi:methylated-DNA-[protein]-cysteine S-methyltransferase
MSAIETVHYSLMESPVGSLLIGATPRGLRYLLFHRGELPQPAKNEVWVESSAELRIYEDQLRAYFRGDLREFSFDLDLIGTDFQKKCWNALCEIPYGQTCCYAELAEKVERPRAFRAVGQANHRNPVAIVVPCHRVVGANGTLTGYGGGLEVKEKLLKLEGARLF